MLPLVESIRESFDNLCASPWVPLLTSSLVHVRLDALRHQLGMTASEYGTQRVLLKDPSAPRHVITYLDFIHPSGVPTTTSIVEILPYSITSQYETHDLRFYSEQEVKGGYILGCIRSAISTLGNVPTLLSTVATLVRAVHLVTAVDDDVDISFSEPNVPFSIFVSVPQTRVRNDTLRVAEAIVHEAMHLQLTLIEQVVPLVTPSKDIHYSPWRGEYRTAQGILHALYVFRVIDRFLFELLPHVTAVEEFDYICRRRGQIGEQIDEVRCFRDCRELTPVGGRLVSQLLSSASPPEIKLAGY